MNIIENEKKVNFVAGFIQRNEFVVSEKPRHIFLGSTDRKAYTVEVSCNYLAERYSESIEIQPWQQQHAENIVQKFVEVAKEKIADRVYKKINEALQDNK